MPQAQLHVAFGNEVAMPLLATALEVIPPMRSS
jgi:hypothetical protein